MKPLPGKVPQDAWLKETPKCGKWVSRRRPFSEIGPSEGERESCRPPAVANPSMAMRLRLIPAYCASLLESDDRRLLEAKARRMLLCLLCPPALCQVSVVTKSHPCVGVPQLLRQAREV